MYQSDPPLEALYITNPYVTAKGDTSLKISTPTKTRYGTLEVTIRKTSQTTTPVKCKYIIISFPIGNGPESLTGNGNQIDLKKPSGWNSHKAAGNDTCTCTWTKSRGTEDFEEPITLTITSIPISPLTGFVPLTIQIRDEDSQEIAVAPVEPIEKAVDDLFYFNAFSCVQPRIPNGGTAILKWEGSDTEAHTTYHLSPSKYLTPPPTEDPAEVTGTSCQVTGLTDTTTFVLDARTPNPNPTREHPDPEAKHHYLSTTLIVENPDIIAKTLTAKNQITVTDTFTANNENNTTTTHGPTTHHGDVTIMANLNVDGTVTATGATNLNTVTATGATNLNTVTATGATNLNTVTATGATNLNTLIATGATTLTGTTRLSDLRGPYGETLKINSNTHILTGNELVVNGTTTLGDLIANGKIGQSRNSGSIPVEGVTFEATTSGIIVATLYSGSRYATVTVTIEGGAAGKVYTSACASTDPDNDTSPERSSATTFVRKGATVKISRTDSWTNLNPDATSVTADYRWIGFGS